MGSSFKPVHRHTQTCDKELSDVPRPVNDLDNHFQTTPRYKVIFKEIFQVLKPFCGRLTSSALSKAEEYSETETYSSGFSEDYKLTKMDKMLAEDYKMGSSFKPVHRH